MGSRRVASARTVPSAFVSVIALVAAACGGSREATAPRTSPRAPAASSTPAGATPPVVPRTPTSTGPAPPSPTAPTAATGSLLPPASAFPLPADFATAVAFAPDGRLFWAERSGTVRVYQGGTAKLFATVSTVTTEPGGGYSERGLLGLAISPAFGQDHFVYAFFSNADRVHQSVVRWTDSGGTGQGAATIVTLPSGPDCCHKGGRLAFGGDGKLYVTLGDEHDAPVAQDTADPRGKLLRYNPDGTIPADNPFGPANPVWAAGLRNPFGLAASPSGRIAVTDNGPSGELGGAPGTGYDTVLSSVAKGRTYQWPVCYGYSHTVAPSASCKGLPGPDWSSENSTVVPTGATFVDASGPTPYAGHLVFCTFNGPGLVLADGTPHAGVVPGPANCRLDVKQGPDHALYYSDVSRIYRQG